MRFLQIEWQNHERSRNSWDIERAEMKARIAKQEGDCRSAKKLNELLEKQVKMLEKALAAERAKNRSASPGQPRPTEEEVKSGWDGRIGLKPSGASFSRLACCQQKAKLPLQMHCLASTSISEPAKLPSSSVKPSATNPRSSCRSVSKSLPTCLLLRHIRYLRNLAT